jgi:hypothetical protein
MTMQFVKAAVFLTVISAAAVAVNGQQGSAGGPCDRVCLQQIADAYLTALAAHDPARAPIAPAAKFTEQAQPMAVGQGQLWKLTAGGPVTFKIPVPDPTSGQIGMIVVLRVALPPAPPRGGGAGAAAVPPSATGPVTVQLALRLKVQNRQITEAEHVFARIEAPAQIAALQTPRPAFLATVPQAERMPRSWMFLVANAYYDSLVLGDGNLTPFADDCGRRENGMHTAGAGRPAPIGPARGGTPAGGPPGGGPQLPSGCAEQLTARAMTYIGSIDLRRIWIADEEKGLVFAYTMFRHPLDAPNKNYPVLLPDGSIRDRTMAFDPFDLEAAHIFKIYGGTLHEIEAMGFTLPLYSKNGWSPFTK